MGGTQAIAAVYLSPAASRTYEKYAKSWQDVLGDALATIEAEPYAPDWPKVPATKLLPNQIEGCIVRDFTPFQFVYQFDAPEEITVLLIVLDFLHSIVM